MLQDNIDSVAEELEKQELEASDGIAPPQIYEQLLAIYLYQNDLCNAKYLWKRIPASVKSSTPELTQIWAVGRCMWQKNLALVYSTLSTVKWSDAVAEIMKLVQEKVRSRAIDMISQAYSSITLEAVAQMTGLTIEVAGTACVERGWRVEADTQIVHPVRPKLGPHGYISSEDQLYKLTNFVSFLEN